MKRVTWVLVGLAVGVAAVCVVRLLIGTEGLGWSADKGLMEIRVARVLAGVAVGGALGASGVVLQTLLRNPLASPDVVGVSAGASVGVMLNLLLAAKGIGGVGAATLATSAAWQLVPAGAGALAVLLLLVMVAGWSGGGREGEGGPVGLLLTGVVVSVIGGAVVMLLQHLMPDSGFASARLLMGSLSDEPTHSGPAAVVVLVMVAGLALGAGRTLDGLILPHDEAVSVGVNVAHARVLALGATGLLCAVAVVLAGPVGFVGLVAPHGARLLMGPAAAATGHAVMLPAAACAGVVLVVGADTVVRLVDLGSGRLPLGVITALVGGPTLIYLLRREAYGRG